MKIGSPIRVKDQYGAMCLDTHAYIEIENTLGDFSLSEELYTRSKHELLNKLDNEIFLELGRPIAIGLIYKELNS